MLNAQNQAADIFERIRKHSTADEVEVLFSGGKSALTRFANNIIHQNVAEENYVVSVRTAFGGRTARSTTNKLDDESLKQVVQSSERLAKVQHPDPDLLPIPDEAGEAPAPHRRSHPSLCRNCRDHAPERADTVKKIVAIAEKHKLTTAGIVSTSESVEGIFNSRGLARLAHADFFGNFDHHAGGGFFGLAESEFARTSRTWTRRRWQKLRPARHSNRRARARFPPGSTPSFSSRRPCSTSLASCSLTLADCRFSTSALS